MPVNGPILIVEDDTNDAETVIAAITELKIRNEIKHFATAKEVLTFLTESDEQPLVIISDIRMPGLDGLSLLRQIQEADHLRLKAIPFVFLTGITSKAIVNEAYSIGVQGFYQKPDNFEALKEQLYFVLHYWARCIHPNTSWLG